MYKIDIATSIKYGNYKHLMPSVMRIVNVIKIYRGEIAKYIDYRKDVTIKFRPIRGNTSGQAYDKRNTIEIDPRSIAGNDSSYLQKLLELLCHELVHSEQYKQNRLVYIAQSIKFEEKTYRNPKRFDEYYNSPWEVEARRRGSEVAMMLLRTPV